MHEFIDLSHAIVDGGITYPGLPSAGDHRPPHPRGSRGHSAPGYEIQIGRITMVANTGTYLDTPFHRYGDGYDLGGLDLARVADVAVTVVDVSTAEAGAAVLTGADVEGRAVLFRRWG